MSNQITITHGSVTITIASHLAPPEKAGKLSPEEVQRIPNPPHGIGLVCHQTAEAIEKAGSKFMLPEGVTAGVLRESGQRAEDIDGVIVDLEVILATLKQANLLFDAGAWSVLRKVNDQVKPQAKGNPELLAIFKQLVEFLAKGQRRRKAEPETK